MSERFNFVYRSNPNANSENGILLRWVGRDSAELRRSRKVQEPLAAFWLPFAIAESGGYAPEKLRQIAASCVFTLRSQIQFIERHFNLSQSEYAYIPQAISETVETPFFSPDTTTEDFEATDDLLNSLFED
jgi:hypothetical protein